MSPSSGTGPPDPGGGQAPAQAQGEVGVALGSPVQAPATAASPQTAPPASPAASPERSRTGNGTEDAEGPPPPANATTVQATLPATPLVWSAEGAARLVQSLVGGTQAQASAETQEVYEQVEAPTGPEDLAANYVCARKPTNLRKDGYQREMTDLEYQTLFLWLTRKIYLEKYPRFLRATMVNMQRDVFADHHMKHLVYKLYVKLPKGFILPAVDANKHFWQNLLKGALESGNRNAPGVVDALFTAQYTTTCEPKDQMVVLTFIRPDVRNKWKNRTLPFTRKTSVTLKSADTLSSDDPFLGYDEGALALQYSCLFIHRAVLTHQQVRAIGKAVAGIEPIDVVCQPPVDSPFAPHFWKITYDQLRCPAQLVNVRMINVTQGDFKVSITVHHERSAFRYPCNACLSVKHATKDCTTQNKEQSIERFSKDLEIPPNESVSGLSKTRSVKELKEIISNQLARWAPAVQLRLQLEGAERSEKKKAAEEKRKAERTEAEAKAKAEAEADKDAKQKEAERVNRQHLHALMKEQEKVMKETKRQQQLDLEKVILEQARLAKQKKREHAAKLQEARAAEAKKKRAANNDPEDENIAGKNASDQEAKASNSVDAKSGTSSSATGQPDAKSATPRTVKPKLSIDINSPSNAVPLSTSASRAGTPHPAAQGANPVSNTAQSTPMEASKSDVKPTSFSVGVASPKIPGSTKKGVQQQAAGARPRTPRLSIRTGAAARRSSAPTIPFIPINLAFATNRPSQAETNMMKKGDESERLTKSEEDFTTTPTSLTATEKQAADEDLDGGDTPMPYGEGVVSPRKRQRPAKEDLEEDGDAKMADKESKRVSPKTKPPSKKEKREAQAHAAALGEDSDDFEPEENQPTFEHQLRPQAENPVSGKKVPGVQSSVTEFFAPSLAGFLGASGERSLDRGADRDQGDDGSNQEEAAYAHADPGRETPSGSSQGDDVQVCYPEMLATQLNTLEQWLAHFEATIIGNLGDGRCFQQAIDATLRISISGTKIGGGKFAAKEAHTLTQITITYLLHYLPQMVKDKTVHIPSLHKRYFGHEDSNLSESEMYEEIVEFLHQTMEYPQGAEIPENRWSGAEEIFGMVWYLREPLFIMSVDAKGNVAFQVYAIEQGQAHSDFDEVMKIRTPSSPEAWALVQTMLNHHVTPKILIHTCDIYGRSGHFTTFRFPSTYYEYWNDDAFDDIPMRHRMENALLRLGLYTTIQQDPLPYAKRSAKDSQECDIAASGSLYEPSSASSTETEGSQLDLTKPLSSQEEAQLLETLNPHLRLRGRTSELWRRAEYANIQALVQAGPPSNPPEEFQHSGDVMTDAIDQRRASPEEAVQVLRSLPHPLVAVAGGQTGSITKLGRELAMIGRRRLFMDWRSELQPDEAERLDALLKGAENEQDVDKKWKAVQQKKLWTSMAQILQRDVLQHRTLPSSDEDQMLQMLVALVAVLPVDAPVPALCYLAHTWISTNGADARQLLTEMHCHQWTRIIEVCDLILGQPPAPTSPDAEAQRIHTQNTLAQSNTTEPTKTSPKTDTADIRNFFPCASITTYNQQMHRNFTEQRMASEARSNQRRLFKKKKMKKTRLEAIMLRTQNVRGLPKSPAKVENWFSIFRGKENHAQAAFTFIQETHATAADGEDLERRYRATWGFNKNAHPMSYWSDNQARAGGVAILLNPYKITVSEPALVELWSPHFIAITCEAEGLSVLLVNIYAPHTTKEREDFFSRIANHRLRHQGPVIVGGDFNCTALPDLDRTYTVTASQHQSSQLQRWTRAWKLSDALSPFFPDQDESSEDLEYFHARYHTYKYQVQGVQHSCRLDRWYVSDNMTEWIQDVTSTDLGGGSDHSAVSLFLADPAHRATTRSQPKLYPPKACAELAVQELSESAIGFLQEHYVTLDTQQATVEAYVEAWELFKIRLTQEIKATTAATVSKVNNSYKTKVTRLRQRLRCPGRSHDEIGAIQRELVATVTQWQGLKKRKRWAKCVATGGEVTKAFFARAAISRKSRPIATLHDTPGAPPRARGDLANRMADGWKAIFQQPAREPKPELYALPLVPDLPQDGARALNEDFNITEIETSIKRCKRTKSGGPDKLPNAWYRDHAAEISPVLLKLFNKCYANGVIPPSFQSAIIVCIPKAGRSADPLGYRPISLLNTDYKIYMRLLASRLKPWLHGLVSPSQGGFVPGREIHDVIDLFTGAQRLAEETNAQTVAVLLDIQKAYDSLDRLFLTQCLESSGFPTRFIHAIQATHSDTTARFSVNGFLSAPLSMTRGIRQGCPLAPILFILALEPLYRGFAADPEMGEPLPEAPGVLPPVGGYADDTALYAANEGKLLRVIENLDAFATISGLRVNMKKSVVLRLNPNAPPLTFTAGFSSITCGEMCRYLGIQVGRGIAQSEVWNLTVSQIEKRLAMATIKTHSVYQRVALAAAIILPKILFVARHHWPSAAWVRSLDTRTRNFVWTGLFTQQVPQGSGAQHWMARKLATLPAKEGGLGIPDISLELATLAAQVVARWGYEPQGPRDVAARLHGMESGTVQANLYLTTTPSRPCLSDTLWSTGSKALGWIFSSTMTFPLQLLIRDGTAALAQATDWRWWRGSYERDFAEFMRIGGREILRMREEDDGKLATNWIPHLAITDKDSAILHQDGSKLTLQHLKALGRGTCVQDFVSWTWVSGNMLRFTPVAPFPLTNAQATTFIMLCNTLAANFPGITRRPDPPELVRTYNIPAGMDVEWFLRDGILHKHVDGFLISSSPVTSQRAIQRQPAIKAEPVRLIPKFECSPTLTRLVRPWRGLQPWKPSRRHFKRSLGRTLKTQGLLEREARACRWKEEDERIAAALDKVRWHDFVAERGLTTYETQLWTRIRHHQLRVWGRSDGERVCQREECSSDQTPAPRHVVWACAHAVNLWRKIAALWGSPEADDSTLLHAIFSRSPLPTEIDWSACLNTQHGTIAGDRTVYWLKTVWVQLITCGMRRLWAKSVRAAVNPAAADPSSGDDFFAVRHQWSNRLRCNITALYEQGGDTVDLDAKILRTIYKGLGTAEAKLSRYPASRARYLLFFDGGSRGNPGPGGSGSIVVRLDPEPQLVWTAAMSYAQRTTTNNYAEYQGLCTGLAAATQNGWHPLEIVGDSMMIIRQMIHRRRPKAPQLQSLYERARAAADQIRVRGWHHHYRSYNKMADKAANQAMDSGTSYQAHTSDIRPEHEAIEAWMLNDVHHWLSAQGTQDSN